MNDGDTQVTQHDFKDKHRYLSGLSIGPRGRQILAQKSTNSGYALTEIPLATKGLLGKPMNFIRRIGWLNEKEVLSLDERADDFDIGLDGNIALAFDNTLKVWNQRDGMMEVAQFDREIARVEYLGSGELAIETNEYRGDFPDFYLLSADGKELRNLSERDFNADRFKSRMAGAAASHPFLEGTAPEVAGDFLDKYGGSEVSKHSRHARTDDGKKAAIFSREGDDYQLLGYDYEHNVLTRLGPVFPEGLTLDGNFWGESCFKKAQIDPSGRYVAVPSKAGGQGEQDLLVWDLRDKRSTVLPSVKDASWGPGGLEFGLLDGSRTALSGIRIFESQSWTAAAQHHSEQRVKYYELDQNLRRVAFMETASYEEKERFMENPYWLGEPGAWPRHTFNQSPRPNMVAVAHHQSLFLYNRESGEHLELGPNTSPEKPEQKFGDGEAWSWTPDSAFLAVPANWTNEGDTRDVLVWDLEKETSFLLPSTREFEIDGNTFKLLAVDGHRYQIPAGNLAQVREQDWYAAAILGGQPNAEDIGDISRQEDGIIVGDVFLPDQA